MNVLPRQRRYTEGLVGDWFDNEVFLQYVLFTCRNGQLFFYYYYYYYCKLVPPASINCAINAYLKKKKKKKSYTWCTSHKYLPCFLQQRIVEVSKIPLPIFFIMRVFTYSISTVCYIKYCIYVKRPCHVRIIRKVWYYIYFTKN